MGRVACDGGLRSTHRKDDGSIGKQGSGTGDVNPEICCDGAIGTPNVSVIVCVMSGEVRMGFLMGNTTSSFELKKSEDVEG
jgi:hypothetical protein